MSLKIYLHTLYFRSSYLPFQTKDFQLDCSSFRVRPFNLQYSFMLNWNLVLLLHLFSLLLAYLALYTLPIPIVISAKTVLVTALKTSDFHLFEYFIFGITWDTVPEARILCCFCTQVFSVAMKTSLHPRYY